MPLHLPDFQQDYIYGLSFCSTVHREPGENFGTVPLKAFAKYKSGDVNALFVVILESIDENDEVDLHFHVNTDREEIARDTSGFHEMDVDALKARVELLYGQGVNSAIDARYLVSRNDLPKRGMIETLLGVSTESCGSQLELRGSRFSIAGGDMFTEMDWRVDDESGCIKGSLSCETDTVIDDDFLRKAIHLLGEGIECFVLENAGTGSNVNSTESPKKRAEG